MSESGKAVRELLAALYGMVQDPRAAALAELEDLARAGGDKAAESVRNVVMSSRRLQAGYLQRAERAERLVVGAVMGLEVQDPPKGHEWVTMAHGQPEDQPTRGRLWCVTCSQAGPVILAGECLARARAAEPEPAAPCSACGVVHP